MMRMVGVRGIDCDWVMVEGVFVYAFGMYLFFSYDSMELFSTRIRRMDKCEVNIDNKTDIAVLVGAVCKMVHLRVDTKRLL